MLFACVGVVACATYEGPPGQLSELGDASGGTGGTSTAGGEATAGANNSRSGAAGASGSANTTGGRSEGGTTNGGQPNITEGGKGGSSGASGSAGGGGKAGSGGNGGSAGNGGSGGSGGGAGKGGAAGSGGNGGSGGSGPAACSSSSPDATCTCVAHDDHDYWFCTTFLTFTSAESKCTAVGMHLPKVETAGEDSFLRTTCNDKTMGEYYLGATDASSQNSWSWLAGGKLWEGVANGTASGYTHWNSNEPNASGDCLVVQTNGAWDDRICTDQRKYICEKP